MGYAGATYRIPCNRGGYTYNQNTDQIDPVMMIGPTRNLNLNEGGRRKRGGTAKVNSTVVSGSPRLVGGFDFQLPTSSFQVFMTRDGKLWKNPTTTLKTGLSTLNFPSFGVFGSTLVSVEGDTTPQTWDGSAGATSNITTPALDWSGATQPKQFITHNRRGWFLMGNSLYYTDLDDVNDVAGGGKITIDTGGDALGLVGIVEWVGRVIAFSRTKAFIIDDTSVDTADWGYTLAAWSGGAAHWRVMVKTPNDLIVMGEDGDIYSVTAVQSFGDYKAASIARPAFIDNYIRENIRLEYIEDFHATYDPTLRAIKFFMVRTGQTEVDLALTFFIDRPAEEAWMPHQGAFDTSGYNASCSFMVRTSVGAYTMYTGDYQGFLWKLEQPTRSDGGLGYYGGFKIPHLNFDNPRVRKLFQRGYVLAKTQGAYNLTVNIWVDGAAKTGTTVSLAGTGGVLGSFVLGTDVLGGQEFIDRPFALKYRGRRLGLEFFNVGVGQDFFASQILIDNHVLGALP
jgi:hypothetical protein